jgi:hypothetical protein
MSERRTAGEDLTLLLSPPPPPAPLLLLRLPVKVAKSSWVRSSVPSSQALMPGTLLDPDAAASCLKTPLPPAAAAAAAAAVDASKALACGVLCFVTAISTQATAAFATVLSQ